MVTLETPAFRLGVQVSRRPEGQGSKPEPVLRSIDPQEPRIGRLFQYGFPMCRPPDALPIDTDRRFAIKSSTFRYPAYKDGFGNEDFFRQVA
jgi:hypothetical protein